MTDKVIEFLRSCYRLGDIVITADSRLKSDLGLSSFELIEMYCRLEAKFKVKVNESDISKIETVGDIVKLIEKRRICQS